MNFKLKIALACVPLALVAACGGGSDIADRLDLADPAVRFVNVSQTAGNLTLDRGGQPHSQATTNTAYPFASNYDFGLDTAAADWTIVTAVGNVPVGNKVAIDPQRGNRYSLVAADSAPGTTNLYLIDDPYNVPLGTSNARLRVMNASYNTPSIDVYMTTGLNADISAAGPNIAAIAINTAGPASTGDSQAFQGDTTYQLRITTAGTKTVLFSGSLRLDNNKDALVLTVPDLTVPGGIKALVKIEGTDAIATVTPI